MYNLATMWLTLSVIFFLCEYVTGMLVMAAFSMEGAVTVCRMLPGYDLNFGIMHGIFLLLLYPAAAIVLDKLMLKEQVEHGN